MGDRVLLLDVMGTLVRDPFYEVVPEFFGLSLDELVAAKHPTAWKEFESDAIDEATLLQRFFADGRPVDGAGLKRAMRSAYAWLDGVEPLLGELRARGVVMHALSNYPRWYELIEAAVGLSAYVPWTFVSCKTGVRKPDPRAYLGPCRALAIDPGACVFVDDREVNCAAAEAVGMTAIRFTDAARLRGDLARLGLPD